jgi:hypothetical protein
MRVGAARLAPWASELKAGKALEEVATIEARVPLGG